MHHRVLFDHFRGKGHGKWGVLCNLLFGDLGATSGSRAYHSVFGTCDGKYSSIPELFDAVKTEFRIP